jgi:hypothetical protein
MGDTVLKMSRKYGRKFHGHLSERVFCYQMQNMSLSADVARPRQQQVQANEGFKLPGMGGNLSLAGTRNDGRGGSLYPRRSENHGQ